ncbi:MAG: 2-hydroxyacid dehydrogenase [Candidatus Anaerobiospirillum merdipullorum]|uniref:2-hydroxyacid dehydrogenase n=1 Tax=Candidatus Anaerobiospirillum merdipullorum TaxID=2838450 RepID=A0A9E2NSU6_9GAMM|nr:2-hydroxyacid dehydrogenase [Candidatus Anaerobiospirillum merdipullorum]
MDTEKIVLLLNSPLPASVRAQLEAQFACYDISAGLDKVPSAELAQTQIIVNASDRKVPNELIACLPHLRLIANHGVGYDGVDMSNALARGIAVTNTPDVLSAEVADLCVALMLALARRVPECDAFVRSGRWSQGEHFPLTCRMYGAKAGIVGLGRIGKEIVKRLRGFEMDIAFYGHHDVPGVRRMQSLEELALFADYLIICVPGKKENYQMINAKILQALGPQGRLINIGRGSVVDEEALTSALEQGTIAGAALDVFACEPQVSERLRALSDRTVFTPHVGTATVQTRQAMADLVLANVQSFAAGKELPTLVPECKGLF